MAKVKKELAANPNAEPLFAGLEDVRSQIAALKAREDEIKSAILEAYGEQIASAYREKGDPFGVVNFVSGDTKLSFTRPKKVTWDQAGLKKLYQEGAPVSVDYHVPEAIFNAQDQDGRDALMPYRTTTPGSLSIKIERA